MSWLKVAFNLLREAVGTEEGREVISNVRSAMRKNPAEEAPSGLGAEVVQALIAEHRAQIDQNMETIVQMLNAQNAKLTEMGRRQRIWNITLAAGLGIAMLVAFLT